MSTMVFQHLMQIRLTEELTELKSEVRVLKMKSQNPFSMNWVIRIFKNSSKNSLRKIVKKFVKFVKKFIKKKKHQKNRKKIRTKIR